MRHAGIYLSETVLDRLMPMHLRLSPAGVITGAGPTLHKIAGAARLVGRPFFDLFQVRRPTGVTNAADLAAHGGDRLFMTLTTPPATPFRGVAFPLADTTGMILNLSFGIALTDAVRSHALTDNDFAPTDLAMELLYLSEAKTAVLDELRNLNARLQGAKIAAEEQALTDTLTGLRNRRAMDQVMTALLEGGTPFGLMHIDLDYFKQVNDTLGHAAGDFVLQEVAKILTAETRRGDTVARVGGDEFVIVLPGLITAPRIEAIATRIIERLSQPMRFGYQTCRISASAGMTTTSHYAVPEADRMLSDADHALYTSKRGGRGRGHLHHD